MTRFVVGLDVGTQSAKVLIFDDRGTVVAEGRQALRPLDVPAPGVAEHPDDDLWDATVVACRRAVERFSAAGHRLDALAAVGICVIRCCRALLRADGSLAHPVINWMDSRLDDPHVDDGRYGEVRYVTTSSGYVGLRLTGERVDTCANLIGWWPVDDVALDWSDDRADWDRCGLRRDQVFALVRPGDEVGRLTTAAAEATGLPAGLPVVATAHDKAVEALGAGALGPGTALVSLGTYIAAMTHGPTFVDDAESFWTFQAAVAGRYLYECWGVRRGMWSVSWFRDQFGAAAVVAADLDAHAERPDVSAEELLDVEAAAVPAGSAGLLTVHDWSAPPHAPNRRGAVVGFDGRHTRAHLYRSLLEGIALRLRTHVTPMAAELGRPVTDVVVSGGGAESDLMMQILADVLGVPTRRNRVRSSAAVGCAVSAGVASGIWATIDDATAALVEPDDAFEPIEAHRDVYDRLAPIEADVHRHLDPLTAALSAIDGVDP